MTDKRLGLSEREYACRAGISRGAVQKARQSGRLVLHADGSIDASASDARRAQATDPSKQRSHEPSPRRGYKPVPDAAVGAVSYEGHTVEYRSLAEIDRAIAVLKGQLASTTNALIRQIYVQQTDKGL
jgi:hypothetical protein